MKYKKTIITLLLILSFSFTTNLLAVTPGGRLNTVAEKATYTTYTTGTGDVVVAQYVGTIINYILSMLGVVFLVLLIYSGFKWMTARGDSDVVQKSKDTMVNAIIGLIIVLMSYAVTFYVVEKLESTTTQNTSAQ